MARLRDKVTNRTLIGNYTQHIEWYHVWWPWLTSRRVARVCQHQLCFSRYQTCENYYYQGGICRGGSRGTPPSLDLTFPPTGLSENLGGMERGGEEKGKGGGDHLPYFPAPTGFCLKYHPDYYLPVPETGPRANSISVENRRCCRNPRRLPAGHATLFTSSNIGQIVVADRSPVTR